jgi:site-specific DNA recombinase
VWSFSYKRTELIYCLIIFIIFFWFREDHSAKNFNRPEFKKLLQYLSKNKGKVDLLLVTSWDRFSRNQTESFAMINRLRNYGCEVQAIEQPLDLSVPENLMILSVYLAMPDIDNRRRSMKITEGVRAAKKQGRWLGKAPFGYKIERDDKNKPLLVPGEKAKVIKKIFADIANGKTQSEVKDELKKKGVYFSRTTFSELIRNQLYIGKIFVTDGSKEKGYYVQGIHQGLIQESLFNQVQETLEENLKKKKFVKAKSFKAEFPLRGLIHCDNCNHPLTGSASKGRNGKHHYYHCNHCHKVRVRVDEIDRRMQEILGELTITNPAKKIYTLMLKQILPEKTTIRKRPVDKIENEISQLKIRMNKLEDGFADGHISADVLNNTSGRYRQDIEILKKEIEFNKKDLSLYQQYLSTAVDLLSNIALFYQKADITVRRKMLGSIFPGNLFFSKEKSRTARINEAVRLILNTSKGFSQQKTGQLFKNLELSGEVEVTGVEPVTFCMPCKRSSQLS